MIATLEYPEMVGVNPEWAHIKMAGLNVLHEFAQVLEAQKLFDIHLNAQKPLRYDQDMSFGADNPKEAVLVVKMLTDYGYSGCRTFDAHPFRTESDPWDFVDRNMRAYKVFEAKAEEVSADVTLCGMLEELQGADDAGLGELLGMYSKKAAQKLRATKFNPDKLAQRRLLYERIDQRLTEILLGAI
jgi:xylose isomerase